MNVDDTDVVLGTKWMYYLGEYKMNYQVPEIRFKNSEGKPILLGECTLTQIKWCPLTT